MRDALFQLNLCQYFGLNDFERDDNDAYDEWGSISQQRTDDLK